ncbi:MAG TPA: MmcQ/YjbR family DNA-binding protein [Methylomirabilota bacterium]|nr:MmcQ/YjbR family DNA-binding protein [Methylomirabilota bacterium]
MTPKDFIRIALGFPGAEQGSHFGATDFRVGGRIFATLAHVKQGYGNLMLDSEQQQLFIQDLPEVFLPVHGGWGRMGATHIVLAKANKDVLTGALRAAYNLRVQKNAKSKPKRKPAKPRPRKPRP